MPPADAAMTRETMRERCSEVEDRGAAPCRPRGSPGPEQQALFAVHAPEPAEESPVPTEEPAYRTVNRSAPAT